MLDNALAWVDQHDTVIHEQDQSETWLTTCNDDVHIVRVRSFQRKLSGAAVEMHKRKLPIDLPKLLGLLGIDGKFVGGRHSV